MLSQQSNEKYEQVFTYRKSKVYLSFGVCLLISSAIGYVTVQGILVGYIPILLLFIFLVMGLHYLARGYEKIVLTDNEIVWVRLHKTISIPLNKLDQIDTFYSIDGFGLAVRSNRQCLRFTTDLKEYWTLNQALKKYVCNH